MLATECQVNAQLNVGNRMQCQVTLHSNVGNQSNAKWHCIPLLATEYQVTLHSNAGNRMQCQVTLHSNAGNLMQCQVNHNIKDGIPGNLNNKRQTTLYHPTLQLTPLAKDPRYTELT